MHDREGYIECLEKATIRNSAFLSERANGKLAEMECAKTISDLINKVLEEGDTIVDAGCGVGHFLRSLQDRLKYSFRYTGFDINRENLEIAQKEFSDVSFLNADIKSIPLEDNFADITYCCNVLPYMPPPIDLAIKELARITSKQLILRIPLGGETTYLIQRIDSLSEYAKSNTNDDIVSAAIDKGAYIHNNIYSNQYIIDILNSIKKVKNIEFKKIDEAVPQASSIAKGDTTRNMSGLQVSGCLVLDYSYIIVDFK